MKCASFKFCGELQTITFLERFNIRNQKNNVYCILLFILCCIIFLFMGIYILHNDDNGEKKFTFAQIYF